MARVTSDGFFSYAPASNTASSTDIVDELDLLLTAGHMGADSKAIIRGEYDTTLAVMDPQSCREAAIAGFPDRPIATAFSYVDTHPRSHTPKGCSLRNQPGNEWNNMVYYNTHPTGTGTAGGGTWMAIPAGAAAPFVRKAALRRAQLLIMSSPEFHSSTLNLRQSRIRPVAPDVPTMHRPYKAIVMVDFSGGADSFNMYV